MGEGSIQRGRGMSLAQDEKVPVDPVGLRWIVAKDQTIQRNENVNAGQGTTRMSRLGRVDDIEDSLPNGETGSGK